MSNVNVKISDYLSHILCEIARGRAMADRESVRLSQTYAENEWMKYYPTPRFVISEMEIDMPVVVSDIDFRASKRLMLDRQKFVIKAKEEFDELLVKYDSVYRMDAPEMGDVILDIHALYQQIIKKDTEVDIMKALQTGYIELYNKVVNRVDRTSGLVSVNDSIQHVQVIDSLLTRIHNFVYDHFVIEEGTLGNIWIDPSTQSVKEVRYPDNLIRIKMKINEECSSIQEIKDSNGRVSKIITLH